MKYTTQIFAGSVARHGFGRDKYWTMNVIERFWVEEDESKEAMSSLYRFEWDSNSVSVAKKQTTAYQHQEEEFNSLSEELDDSIFMPDYMHAVSECQTMSRADCIYLIRNVSEFAQASLEGIIKR